MRPHEVEPWLYSRYRGRVEALDARSIFPNSSDDDCHVVVLITVCWCILQVRKLTTDMTLILESLRGEYGGASAIVTFIAA